MVIISHGNDKKLSQRPRKIHIYKIFSFFLIRATRSTIQMKIVFFLGIQYIPVIKRLCFHQCYHPAMV